MYFCVLCICKLNTSLNRSSSRRGIDIGDVQVLVYVEELQGKRYVCDKSGPRGIMSLEKQWSASSTPYPLQTIVSLCTCIKNMYLKMYMYMHVLFFGSY